MNNLERAYVAGFLKAANAMQIPPVGAPSTPPGIQPGQPPQPGTQQGLPQQPMAQSMPQGNQMFYQLLAQLKQGQPQVSAPPVPSQYIPSQKPAQPMPGK